MSIMFTTNERQAHKKRWFLLFIFLLIIIFVFLNMSLGPIRLLPLELIQTFLGNGTVEQRIALFDFRLPRMVVALLIGAGLAVSGLILQGVSRNVLADPGILGINAGAGL